MDSFISILQSVVQKTFSNLTLYILIIVIVEWLFRIITNRLIAYSFGNKVADVYDGDITFLGVIHHELSHTLLAVLTGARITNMKLYIPRWVRQHSDNPECLGYVYFATQGIQPLPVLQRLITGFAPAILGAITSVMCTFVIWHEWKSVGWSILTKPICWFLLYVILSVTHHACPSGPDIKAAGIGLMGALIIGFIFPMPASIMEDVQYATMILICFVSLPLLPFMVTGVSRFIIQGFRNRVHKLRKEESL